MIWEDVISIFIAYFRGIDRGTSPMIVLVRAQISDTTPVLVQLLCYTIHACRVRSSQILFLLTRRCLTIHLTPLIDIRVRNHVHRDAMATHSYGAHQGVHFRR